MAAWVCGSLQWPTTTLRRSRSPGVQEPRLPVAVGGLVEVHEVHVDVGPRQVAVELRVQMQERFRQRRQAADPHLGGRERVHPQDQSGAGGRGVGLEHERADFLGPGEDGLENQRQRQDAGVPEFLDNLSRVGGDLLERLLAVEVLAAGDEPDFAGERGPWVNTFRRDASGCKSWIFLKVMWPWTARRPKHTVHTRCRVWLGCRRTRFRWLCATTCKVPGDVSAIRKIASRPSYPEKSHGEPSHGTIPTPVRGAAG